MNDDHPFYKGADLTIFSAPAKTIKSDNGDY